MIFAKISDRQRTQAILNVLKHEFGDVEWADQGTEESPDAYFWVKRHGVTVAVDNLTSTEFQVKCARADAPLIGDVIKALAKAFSVTVYDEPEHEAHE